MIKRSLRPLLFINLNYFLTSRFLSSISPTLDIKLAQRPSAAPTTREGESVSCPTATANTPVTTADSGIITETTFGETYFIALARISSTISEEKLRSKRLRKKEKRSTHNRALRCIKL